MSDVTHIRNIVRMIKHDFENLIIIKTGIFHNPNIRLFKHSNDIALSLALVIVILKMVSV